MKIAWITTLQMIEVDRLMIEEYSIQLTQMMENAGRNLAEMSRRILGGEIGNKHIAVFCGAGNNGGGGMVAARHLSNWGANIKLKILPHSGPLQDVPAHQFQILNSMGILNREAIDLDEVDLVIDAMIGYGLKGDPLGAAAEWIRRINAADRSILALDAPSGLDTTTGKPRNPCIRAKATMTLALPKTGLMTPEASEYVGELYLADISVPPELYSRLGFEVPPMFTHDTILKIEK